MQMMKCPVCAAPNSVKRTSCFQCQADLHAQAVPAGTTQVRLCKNCAHAAVSPPRGTIVASDEIWCLKLKAAKNADNPAEGCFERAFTWTRTESLD